MEQFSIGLKLQELAVLLHKHCSPDSARLYLLWTNLNLNSGNVDILETNLNLFRRLGQYQTKVNSRRPIVRQLLKKKAVPSSWWSLVI